MLKTPKSPSSPSFLNCSSNLYWVFLLAVSHDPNKIRFLLPFFCSPRFGEESSRNLVSILLLPSLEFLLYSPLPMSRYRSLSLIQAFEKNSPLVSLAWISSLLQSILHTDARHYYSKMQTWTKIILAQARGRYWRCFKWLSLNLLIRHSKPCPLWFQSAHP